MIMIEAELRSIANRRMTNQELELAKYAAAELRAKPIVLVRDCIRKGIRTKNGRDEAETVVDRKIAGVATRA